MTETVEQEPLGATDTPVKTKPWVSEREMREIVRRSFGGEGRVITWDVGNAAGDGNRRHVDAVIVDTWQSRGFSIEGVEIKLNRSDWLRELKIPDRDENLHHFCDKWWILAAEGVIRDVDEVPPRWGFIEVQMRTGRPISVIRRKPDLGARPQAIPRGFVASLMRASQRAQTHEFATAVEARVKDRLASERDRWNQDTTRLQEEATGRLRKLTEALGAEGVDDWLSDESLLRAVAIVAKSGISSEYGGLSGIIGQLRHVQQSATYDIERLVQLSEAFGIPVEKDRVKI